MIDIKHRLLILLTALLLCTASVHAATLSIDPASQTANSGDTVEVNVKVSAVSDLYGYQFDVRYGSSILQLIDYTEQPFLAGGGETFCTSPTESPGLITNFACSKQGAAGGVSGSGNLYAIRFTATGTGTADISIENALLVDSNVQPISVTTLSGKVTVGGSSCGSADTNDDGRVSFSEISSYFGRWFTGTSVSNQELDTAVGFWLNQKC